MTTQPPIACTLTPDELRARREGLLPGLATRAVALERVDGGVRLQFAPAPGIVSTIAQVVDGERQCCRFLQFAITTEADDGPVALRITAPPEAQDVLSDLVGMPQ
jgi:hypothetical protein